MIGLNTNNLHALIEEMKKIQFTDMKLPSNQKFGFFIASLLFLASAFYVYLDEKFIAIFFAFTVIIILTISIWLPSYLFPLNKLWMQFGFMLGMIISPIVMALIFFLIFTPIGVITRLFGRDELSLKLIKCESFWKEREVFETSFESFKNQY
jgi:hypothetical protein